MSESVQVTPVSNAPATEAEIAAHEAVDQLAHEQIAQEEEEDYRWLTERLDAITNEHKESKQVLQTAMTAVQESLTPLREAMNQLQETNRQLSSMVQTMSETLTTLAASAVLRSNPETLTPTSRETATVTEQVTEQVNPENAGSVAPTGEQETRPRRKRL